MARCGAVASWAALGRAQQLAKPGALLRTNKRTEVLARFTSRTLYSFFVKFFFRPDHECLFFLSEPALFGIGRW